MKDSVVKLTAALSLSVLCAQPAYSLEFGQPLNFNPNTNTGQPYLLKTRPGEAVDFKQRANTLEELITTSPFPGQIMQPIPLHGVRIGSLESKTVDALGFQYFVVVDNTKYTRMSEIYKENRLGGKSNFVTSDSIIHPYLAFTNRIMAEVVVSQIMPDLKALVQAMLKVTINDYKETEDAEVRQDLELNIAYLSVAMRFLDQRFEVPRLGQVPELVEDEMSLILKGKEAYSQIFARSENFSNFTPVGWYNANSQLQNYYRCKAWLSQIAFPVNDVSSGQSDHTTNNFRRSVLLFRSLDLAKVLGKPAIDIWARLVASQQLLGTQLEAWQERALYAPDYKLVFENQTADLKVTLDALSEPFYRTKLLLAIRRHKPVNLTSTSIFELEDSAGNGANAAVFRFFPIIGEPESPWLHSVARAFPKDKEAASSWPLSLLTGYAWGSPLAGNMMAANLWTLDPAIAPHLTDLQHCILRRSAGGQTQVVDSRSWRVLSQYFKPLPEGVPGVLRTELWSARRLLSAAAGWVDRRCAIMPPLVPGAQNDLSARMASNTNESAATSDSISPAGNQPNAAVQRKISKIPPYHYLDPSGEIYKQLLADTKKLQADLDALHYMPEAYRPRLLDFSRLFERLIKIADTETRGTQVSVIDRRLLANIDQILDKVDVPLPTVLPFDTGEQSNSGFNLAVGRPGLLFIIYQNPHNMEWTLGRGAVYTYYEMAAPLLTASMWNHKLEAGFAKPPLWSGKFEMVQAGEKR